MSEHAISEFDTRLIRAFDAATMDRAADVTAYALLGVPLTDEELRHLTPVLAPILAALVHVSDRAADLLGVTRSELIKDVRENRLNSET